MDNGQAVYDNRTLTHNLCSNQVRNPNHNLCSSQPRMVRIWSMVPLGAYFWPPLPTHYQPEKAKYIP